MKFQYQSPLQHKTYTDVFQKPTLLYTVYGPSCTNFFRCSFFKKVFDAGLFVLHWSISLRGAGLLLDICSYGRISLCSPPTYQV